MEDHVLCRPEPEAVERGKESLNIGLVHHDFQPTLVHYNCCLLHTSAIETLALEHVYIIRLTINLLLSVCLCSICPSTF